MLNHVTLLGRLAHAPKLKTTQTGTAVARFDLAVDKYKKDADPDYIPIVCWKDKATFADRHLTKGRQIVVEGRIDTSMYLDVHGNRRKSVEVVAESIYFADSNRSNNGGQENAENSQTPSADFEAVEVDDEDLPF